MGLTLVASDVGSLVGGLRFLAEANRNTFETDCPKLDSLTELASCFIGPGRALRAAASPGSDGRRNRGKPLQPTATIATIIAGASAANFVFPTCRLLVRTMYGVFLFDRLPRAGR